MEKSVFTIGIRREHENNWERRTALTPETCKDLIDQGYRIIVEPCDIRVYTDFQYEEVGCELSFKMEEADLIVGVQRPTISKIIPNKTYIFFSHTFKGQKQNMPLLKELLERNVRLIDYECIKDDNQNRLVAFGRIGGMVGANDIIRGLGQFLLMKGLYTPFLHVSMAYNYISLEKMKSELIEIAEEIVEQRFPKSLTPIIFGVTGGKGRVAQGALSILKLLPHEIVQPDDLPSLVESGGKNDRIYITELSSCHLFKKNDEPFDKSDFYANPKEYKSIFATSLLPYLSVLIHGAFWDPRNPKIIKQEEVVKLSEEGKLRLIGVQDITCDLNGSSELLKHLTNIETPFYAIHPETFETTFDLKNASLKSILYSTVSNLPAELPVEASDYFSSNLGKFIPYLEKSHYPSSLDEQDLPNEIKNAIITNNSELTPKYAYLQKLFEKFDN